MRKCLDEAQCPVVLGGSLDLVWTPVRGTDEGAAKTTRIDLDIHFQHGEDNLECS